MRRFSRCKIATSLFGYNQRYSMKSKLWKMALSVGVSAKTTLYLIKGSIQSHSTGVHWIDRIGGVYLPFLCLVYTVKEAVHYQWAIASVEVSFVPD